MRGGDWKGNETSGRLLGLVVAGLCLTAPMAHAQAIPSDAQDGPASAQAAAQVVGTLTLPVIVDGAAHGAASATVTLSDVLAVSASDLADALAPVLNEETAAALRALGPGMVSADAIRSTGLTIAFDSSSITLRLDVPASHRGEQDFSSLQERYTGLERVDPQTFALGLTGALVTNARLDDGSSAQSNLVLSGFANLGGVRGVNLYFGGDVNLTGGGDGFRRDRILAFRDDPRRALRMSAGDILPVQARMAGQVDMLGVSFERNHQALDPLRNVRAVGRRSLVLERRSTVEVYVNGALVQSFIADPGPINIRDIPLAELSNNVSVVVEDDLGRRELEAFSVGADLSLLAEGVDEFNFSAGLMRDESQGRFSYSEDPVVSLYYARGVRQNLTLTGHLVVTEALQNTGVAAAFGAFGGVALVETAASQSSDAGGGAAVSFTYRGDPFGQAAREGALNLRAEMRSDGFREATALGLIDSLKLDLAADYRLRVTQRTAINFGGSYFTSYGVTASNRSAFFGVSQNLGRFTASATLRYLKQGDRGTEVGGFLTLSMPIGSRGSAFASYDSVTETTRAEFRRRRSLEYPSVDLALRAQQRRDEAELGGRIGYETARFDAVADVSQMYRQASSGDRTTGTLRLQSGVAYVDGRIGVGRDPGRGFLMVSRHPSLGASPVEVRSGAVGRALGSAGAWGPAVIPVSSPYRPQEIRVNPLDLPPGYDIGPGGYVLYPGAASGLSIQVGDDAYRIALGYLLTDEGEVIALRTGQLREVETGQATAFFTNAQGRIALNRLAPGRYRIETDDGDWVHEFEVRDGDPALIDLGRITMGTTR